MHFAYRVVRCVVLTRQRVERDYGAFSAIGAVPSIMRLQPAAHHSRLIQFAGYELFPGSEPVTSPRTHAGIHRQSNADWIEKIWQGDAWLYY